VNSGKFKSEAMAVVTGMWSSNSGGYLSISV